MILVSFALAQYRDYYAAAACRWWAAMDWSAQDVVRMAQRHYNATILTLSGATMQSASLTIRNIPQPVLDRLKARARQNHRSMQGEIRAILEQAAAGPRNSLAEAYARMRATGVQSAPESAALIRADRDDR
jgi:antitoxin FitA